MHKTAILTGKRVFGFSCFSDGLAATSVLLSYEAEKAVKHLSTVNYEICWKVFLPVSQYMLILSLHSWMWGCNGLKIWDEQGWFMPVHVTVQFNLTAHLEKKRKWRMCVISARSCCYLQPLHCWFFLFFFSGTHGSLSLCRPNCCPASSRTAAHR